MNKPFLLILLCLCSCTQNIVQKNFDFSNKMSFDEFMIKLNEYAKTNPYPNIDD